MTSNDTKLPIPASPAAKPVSRRMSALFVLYGIALLWVGVAAGHGFAAVAILGAWAYVFSHRSRPFAFVMALIALAFLLLLWSLNLSLIYPRAAAWRSQCKNNLKQIGLALHNYHDDYDSFPPVVTYDDNGRPMHSWRVLLLPYMDHRPLYEEYDLAQPWDSPVNLQLEDQMPDVYRCPSRVLHDECRQIPSYVAVVDEQTYWPPDATVSLLRIEDGNSNTIAVVECDALDTPWLQPVDLSLDEAILVLTIEDPRQANGHHDEDRYYVYHHGRHVLMGDGSVRFIPSTAPADAWRAALTVDDGRTADELEVPVDYDHPNRVPKVGNWVRWWTFVVLCVLPLPWVFWNPTSQPRNT